MRGLEGAYLRSADPMVQSGFSAGRERWVAERSPLVAAFHRDGCFLDVGCANGLLAADVVGWARDRGITIEPHGVDLGERLIDLARGRHPGCESNFVVADAWMWDPPRRWTFVYSLLDLSPPEMWGEWIRRLGSWVEPGGRLIMASYGSRSRSLEPVDVAEVMKSCGLPVDGSSHGGEPVVTSFAWTEIPIV